MLTGCGDDDPSHAWRSLCELPAPEKLVDPSVEQLLPAGEDIIAVLISHVESAGAETRQLPLYFLERRATWSAT